MEENDDTRQSEFAKLAVGFVIFGILTFTTVIPVMAYRQSAHPLIRLLWTDANKVTVHQVISVFHGRQREG